MPQKSHMEKHLPLTPAVYHIMLALSDGPRPETRASLLADQPRRLESR